MVQCAMCDSPATHHYDVPGYGKLEVCGNHHWLLTHNAKETMKDILTRIMNALNDHYTKIPLVQAPTRKFENNGRRWGLKTAIEEVEKEMEALIKNE